MIERKYKINSIQYASDLHLEFSNNYVYLNKNRLIPTGDILILNGDIDLFDNYFDNDLFHYFSDNWKDVWIIPGNHEYYNTYDKKMIEKNSININIFSNINVVDNQVIKYNNVSIICSTLWSKIGPANEWFITRHLNDFRVIRDTEGSITPIKYNNKHKASVKFISDNLNKFDNVVIASHHAPTLLINSEEYKDSKMNEAFVTELFDLINDSPNLIAWIYGHTHYNKDVEINNTKVISNQFGYYGYGEQESFQLDKILKIK